MARQKNPNGTRQMALRALDEMTHLTRAEMLINLREMFPLAAEDYLKTLWATHRRESKESGALIEVFSIRDTKDGKPCRPFLKSEFVFHPTLTAPRDASEAKEQYTHTQKMKINQANQLR